VKPRRLYAAGCDSSGYRVGGSEGELSGGVVAGVSLCSLRFRLLIVVAQGVAVMSRLATFDGVTARAIKILKGPSAFVYAVTKKLDESVLITK
jgi:hypothetical protein